MDTIAFVLDIFLVIAAFAAYLSRPHIGGQLARGIWALDRNPVFHRNIC